MTGRLRHGQDSPPEPPSPCGAAPREARPRLAWNAASGCASDGGCRRFLQASPVIVPARMLVSRAKAHSASVRCRYQPVQLRTASWSRPTSPVASSTPLSMVQRLPAPPTTAGRVVTCGAKTTSAVMSVGALTRRRTSHQRHPPGANGAVRDRQCPSDQRGPCAPSPALRRIQPSSGTVARRRLPCRCGHPSPPYA
jgi:hypothetical protein